jgi:peptidyl-dipeptidase Dcp
MKTEIQSSPTPALTAEWTGPYGGVPSFVNISPSDFKPAFEEAMASQLREINAIGTDDDPPDFENTIAALERSGKMFSRVHAIYSIWSGGLSTPEFQQVETELEPVLAAFEDSIYQHEALFRKISEVYHDPKSKALNGEQRRLLWMRYTDFVRAGAKLSAEDKRKLSDINQKLAGLFTRFSQNILADEQRYILLDREEDLDGLPTNIRGSARALAVEKGYPEKWLVLNTRSSIDPFLTYATRRDLRERAWKMFVNRGNNKDEHDNNGIIVEILKLRLERANLLGYETHAHWALENTMAKTPTRALELLYQVWTPATNRVREEVKAMQDLADRNGDNVVIEPWDYRFYMEKVRKERYDLDDNELRPYLQLDKLRESMFFVANKLFGMAFRPLDNIPVFHPDVRVWAVEKDNIHVGLFYFDPFARAGKRSGAWMSDYREQSQLDRPVTPIVSNNSNFLKGNPGEPTLISWDDATTLFHEFGHALHGLSSKVTYPSLSGTNVVRDYVEFPSQLLEHWLMTREVLETFAVHYETGEAIPATLVEKLKRAATFNQGFGTTEYLASAVIDLKLHLATEHHIVPERFEKGTLTNLGMPRELVMRHRMPQFLHVFSSDDYAAGYYSYLWADIITADAYNAFEEGAGPFDEDVANRLLKYVLSAGNTIDPDKGYQSFRGKAPAIDSLLKKRGFIDQVSSSV